jgi:hypothetical protein
MDRLVSADPRRLSPPFGDLIAYFGRPRRRSPCLNCHGSAGATSNVCILTEKDALNEREMSKAWAGFVGIGEPHHTRALGQTDRGPPLLAITVNLFRRETPYIRFSQCRLSGAKFAAMCTLLRGARRAIPSGPALLKGTGTPPPGELRRAAVMSGGLDQPSPLEKSHPPESIQMASRASTIMRFT